MLIPVSETTTVNIGKIHLDISVPHNKVIRLPKIIVFASVPQNIIPEILKKYFIFVSV